MLGIWCGLCQQREERGDWTVVLDSVGPIEVHTAPRLGCIVRHYIARTYTHILTMLHAVRPPLTLCDFAENTGPLIEQFIDDAVFCGVLEVFEGMLITVNVKQRRRACGSVNEPELRESQSRGKQEQPICLSRIY